LAYKNHPTAALRPLVWGIAPRTPRFAALFAVIFRYEIGTLSLLDVREQLFFQ
jgi:hypothetical protein